MKTVSVTFNEEQLMYLRIAINELPEKLRLAMFSHIGEQISATAAEMEGHQGRPKEDVTQHP